MLLQPTSSGCSTLLAAVGMCLLHAAAHSLEQPYSSVFLDGIACRPASVSVCVLQLCYVTMALLLCSIRPPLVSQYQGLQHCCPAQFCRSTPLAVPKSQCFCFLLLTVVVPVLTGTAQCPAFKTYLDACGHTMAHMGPCPCMGPLLAKRIL